MITGSPYGSLNSSVNIIFAILIIFLLIRIFRSSKPRKFNIKRVIYYPLIYLLISVYSYYLFPSILVLEIAIPILIVGLLIGTALGGNPEFLNKDEKIYYKRSRYISAMWSISFLVRIYLSIYYPTNFEANSVVTLLLIFTSGMLIGESINLYKAYKVHKLSIKAAQSNKRNNRMQ